MLLSASGARASPRKTSSSINLPSKYTILASSLPSRPILSPLLKTYHPVPANSSLPSTLSFVLHCLLPTNSLTAQEIANHFKQKIDTIRKEISTVQIPSTLHISCPQVQSLLPSFNPTTIDEVAKLLANVPPALWILFPCKCYIHPLALFYTL